MFKFIWILVLILAFMVYGPYMDGHAYYMAKLGQKSSWIIVLGWLFAAFIPVLYMILKNKFLTENKSMKSFLENMNMSSSKDSKVNLTILALLFVVGFTIFFWIIGSQKWGYVWWGIMWLFNFYTLFLFFTILIVGFYAIWLALTKKLFANTSLDKNNFLNFLIRLWAWTAIFSFVALLLVIFGIINLFTAILLFWILITIIWFMGKDLLETKDWIEVSLTEKIVDGELNYLYFFLISLSVLYIYFGFYYSFIPYPTAWDANHAYMYIPRMRAENGGYLWAEKSAWKPGNIWQWLLAWVYTLNGWTSFSQDTWMVETNFLSAIFTLLAWLWLTQEMIKISFAYKNKKFFDFQKKAKPVDTAKFEADKYTDVKWNYEELDKALDERKELTQETKNATIVKSVLFLLWFLLILTWLTSGMGAFLVFVDNKMDLTMLFFSILAILSAIKMLRTMQKSWDLENPKFDLIKEKINYFKKDYMIYAIFTGVFFGIANIIKPTANLDVLGVGIIVAMLWFGWLALLAIVLVAVWVLSIWKIHYFHRILDPKFWLVALVVWFIIWFFDAFKIWVIDKRKVVATTAFLLSFVLTLLSVKWTMEIFKLANGATLNPTNIVKSILLWKNTIVSETDNKKHNLQCAWSCNLSMYNDLYEDLKTPPGEAYSEDNGRYVWYGWKEFVNPWWWFFIPPKDNLWKYNDLLTAMTKISEKDFEWFDAYTWNFQSILDTKVTIEEYRSLSGLNYQEYFVYNQSKIKEEIKGSKIFSMLEENKDGWADIKVNIPYKYLIPFNVTFNWSLQNSSSYYTDIWVNWLILFVLVLIWLVYSLFKQDKLLLSFSLSTVIYWVIWHFIASGIIWYGIWGIIFMILSLLLFLQRIYKGTVIDNVFMWILFLVFALALPLNFFRISSYGWVWPFTYYRWWGGENHYNPAEKIIPYTSEHIFDMSFWHYTKLIEEVNARQEWEKLLIAWTYAKYFFKNQKLIKDDQFLMSLWKWFSDEDICKSYLRLKDQWIKHIVVDPNLWTVTKSKVWANAQLRNRFYAKQNPLNKDIEESWVMVMLVDLAQEGYVELAYTNNIGIKYALILTDEEITEVTWFTTPEEIKEFRYKLTVMRYGYISDFEETYLHLINLMYWRIVTWQILEDVADMYKYNIDKEDLQGYLWMLINKRETLQENWTDLPGPVMHVLSQYNIWLNYIQDWDKEAITETLVKTVKTNISSSSQILWVRVK